MEFLKKIKTQPPAVQDYVLGPEISKRNATVLDQYRIPFGQQKAYMAILQSVLVKETPLERLPESLASALGQTVEAVKPVARDVAGLILLPLDGFLGDVSAQIRAWGGDPASYPTDRVVVPTSQQPPVVTVAMTLNSHLKERYQTIAESFFRGVRTEAQVLELLEDTVRKGYAVSDQDVVVGIASVGAPIFDGTGQVTAAISIGGTLDGTV